MRIKWGFLTSLTLCCVVITASEVRGDEKPTEEATQQDSAESQVPLRSNFSFGWAPQPNLPPAVQPASHGLPFPGGPFPAGPVMPASLNGPPGMPQPFPGPPAAPLEHGMGPGYGGPGYGSGEYDGDYVDPPYPGPFDGWVDGRSDCAFCGGAGCNECAGAGGGLLGWLITGMRPYPEGGICAPRWYDITMDAMFLQRQDVGRDQGITSLGINGDIILSTGDLSLQNRLGFRFTGATQISAGLIAEFTYFGLFNWSDQQMVRDDTIGDFFSVYSDFGTNPFNGFDETDRSHFQEITFSSTIDSFELNFRRRWSAPNCLVQGSWLGGVRYIYLVEDFEYNTNGGDDLATPILEVNGKQQTDIRTRNSLTGFQIGGDLWTTIVPGISLGGEMKGGVYGNYGNQRTVLFATTTLPPAATTVIEEASINDVAFAGEARLEAIYRTGPNWTIRAGYTFFVMSGVALAANNLNTSAPPSLQAVGTTPRPAFKNDDGDVFLHGGHVGIEWIW